MSDLYLMKVIADMVPVGARVLDLGCGKGELLAYLIKHRQCTGYGVEIDDANVLACAQRGVNVIQLNLDEGLAIFEDASFDVVLQIDTLQHLHNTEIMLKETARVGRLGIVAFPNFGHWSNRWSILRGRMPVNQRLPYEWYNTPNIRVTTATDFQVLAERTGLKLQSQFGIQNSKKIEWLANLRASTAVFSFTHSKINN